MDAPSKSLIQVVADLGAKLGAPPPIPPQAAYLDSREEILVRYVIGRGQFSKDGKFININCKAFKLDGTEDGTYIGVDQPVFQNVSQTFLRPHPPYPPFDKPQGPLDHIQPLSFSKGLRTFLDGSTITAIGPGNLHVVSYIDSASQFWVTSNLIVTNGTGRYEGARGLKIVGGSTWVEPGKPLTALDEFSVKTVEVYRIIAKKYIAG